MLTVSIKRIAIAVILLLLFVPFVTKALTSAEVDAQIRLLLTQITSLQARIQQYSTSRTPSLPVVSQNPTCPVFDRVLSLGSYGTDVSELQNFLVAAGLLSQSSVSNSYDALTEQAVRRWQATHGVVSSGTAGTTGYGVVGPRTRALIALNCALTTTRVLTPSTTEPLTCAIAPPPMTVCSTGWKAVTDPYGCTTSYTCSTPLQSGGSSQSSSTTSSTNTSLITIISPTEGLGIRQGTTLNIAWSSKNIQGSNTVRFELVAADSGAFVRAIAHVPLGSPVGSYYWWSVPSSSGSDSVLPGRYKMHPVIQENVVGESGTFTILSQ